MSVRIATILSVFTACAAGGIAHAQTMSGGTSASFNGGYGRYNGQENHPVDFSIRDSNGNLTAVDGILQPGNTSFASNSGNASANASAGAFSGGVGASSSASAIGNNLTVVTQGNFNTVIVNSTQINNGDVTAGSTATAGVKNAQ